MFCKSGPWAASHTGLHLDVVSTAELGKTTSDFSEPYAINSTGLTAVVDCPLAQCKMHLLH